jgi:hypothetical protein
MHPHARQISIRVPLDRLSVCRICGDLHGVVIRGEPEPAGAAEVVTRSLHQHCACTSTARIARWEGYDFNQAVTLCRCCTRRVLVSGMRWSEWFCGDCHPQIEDLNNRCRATVIPSSRHTLMTTIAGNEQSPRPLPNFAVPLGDWFDRVELLEKHALAMIHENLHSLGLETLDTDVSLADYLKLLPMTQSVQHASLRALAAAFRIPASLLVGIA